MYHEHYNIDTIGKIGIVLQSHFYFPKDAKKPEDVEAANRLLQFWVGLQIVDRLLQNSLYSSAARSILPPNI